MTENSGYEKRDVKVISVIGYAIGIIAFLVVVILLLNDYFMASKEELVYNVYLKPESTEIRDIRALDIENLTTYKCLDEKNGVYRIPIERAMQLLAEEKFKEQLQTVKPLSQKIFKNENILSNAMVLYYNWFLRLQQFGTDCN